MNRMFLFGCVVFVSCCWAFTRDVSGDEKPAISQDAGTGSPPTPDSGPEARAKKPLEPLPPLLAKEVESAVPLNPDATVMLDKANGRVVLRTEVACPDCVLEMLLVPDGNREHETILRIRSKAYVIHTGLLALGLEPGKGAEFSPKFVPASGPVIMMEAVWVNDKQEVQRQDIREWVRHNIHRYYAAPLSGPPPGVQMPYKQLRWDKFNNELLWFGPMSDDDRDDLLSKWDQAEYQTVITRFHEESQSREMTSDFVFVGSSMYTDPDTGLQHYQAEGGHVICTSNFSDALIDVREESSASDGSQTYEGWTERIPKEGTPVLLVLKPKDLTPSQPSTTEQNPKR